MRRFGIARGQPLSGVWRPLVEIRATPRPPDAMLAQSERTVAHGRKTALTLLALAVFLILLAVSNGLAWMGKDANADISFILRWEFVYHGVGFAVGAALFLAYAGIQRRFGGARLILAAVLLCYVSGLLWRFLSGLAMHYLGMNPGFKPDLAMLFVRGGLVDGTMLGLFSFLYFGIEHWTQAAEQKENARRATSLAHQAQLQMLRYQLNPHFLFNVLNSIRGMIVEDPSRSREMVTELADFLRYSLDGTGQESSVGDEIQAIQSYLTIQRIRFEDQLEATVRVEDGAEGVTIPCFLIHPLVENAVKHGMKTSPMPLRLRIAVRRDGAELLIAVSNTGRIPPPAENGGSPEGAGIGLKNVTERLALVFPERHSFHIHESDGWVHAEIRLRLSPPEKLHAAS